MNVSKKIIIFLIPVILILALGDLIVRPAFRYLNHYFSKSEQVEANILIVEGWLPRYAVDIASQEYRKNGYDYIITTGIRSAAEYYGLAQNGYLIFYPGNKFKDLADSVSTQSIEVEAYSELGGEHSAHFNLYINDSVIADFHADRQKRKYAKNWVGSLSKIDSVMIQFDNDDIGDFGDVNLYVNSIIVNNKTVIPYFNNSVYVVPKPGGILRVVNNFRSNAELTKTRLTWTGIEPSRIIAIPGKKVNINRTLSSALAFRDWVKATNIEIKGINIISLGTHARRTWMTYNRILHEKYNIGIISLPDYRSDASRKSKFLKTVRESVALVYYWFILLPY
jgi:hypothetical protein